jgi:nicotinate-nucleotide pyrophosphorylase (carboxylating)
MLISPLIEALVRLALEEDLAYGDVTSQLLIPPEQLARGVVVAREELVVAGCELIQLISDLGRFGLTVKLHVHDGETVQPETSLATIAGPAHSILSAERTILNFLQRMCGVATHTHSFVQQVGPGITVLDTRKTLPGWRLLDKYAVRVGGGKNHRLSLGDMILVKNNHIDAHPDGIHGVLRTLTQSKPPYMPWEVEVRSTAELKAALAHAPTIVMLDNFTDESVAQAVALVSNVSPRPLLEVSGGITKERASALKALGVDAVSAGALTTAARNVDISLRVSLLTT